MILIILESPYKATSTRSIQNNIDYARECMKDSFDRGEAPFASHLLYTQHGILDDKNPEERRKGIEAGLLWGKQAEKTVVYTDFEITDGMQEGIDRADAEGRPVEKRRLYDKKD